MLLYPTYIANKENITIIFNSYSDLTLDILGINLSTCFTPVGYYTIIFKYITLLSAIEASILGTKVIINDCKNQFLYTKPITRNKILTSKLCALLLCLLITNLVYQITSCLLMFFLTGVDYKALLLINLGLLFFQITFSSIIMMIASFIKNTNNITIISFISIVIFYTLSIIEEQYNNIILRYINPFSYFKASDILENGNYSIGFIFATIFIIFYMINFSYIHNNELEM